MNNTQNGAEAAVKTEQNGTGKAENLREASEKILMNHLVSFQKNDLDGVMSDFTNDSIFMTQTATYTGLAEIRAFFAELITHFPMQDSMIQLDKTVIKDDLIYIVWHAKTPSLEIPLASDTILIRHGKIFRQTFIGQLNFIN